MHQLGGKRGRESRETVAQGHFGVKNGSAAPVYKRREKKTKRELEKSSVLNLRLVPNSMHLSYLPFTQ